MVELLKKGQYKPLNVVDQIMVIYAGNGGYLNEVPIPQVAAWEQAFLTFMRDQRGAVRSKLEEKKDLTAEIEGELKAAIADFKKQWKPA